MVKLRVVSVIRPRGSEQKSFSDQFGAGATPRPLPP